MQILDLDLLKFEGQYIAHQCNCISRGSKGLVKRIFDIFPEVNVYKNREKPDIPGTISLKTPTQFLTTDLFVESEISKSSYIIINLFAQYYPGKSNNTNDSELLRLEWFRQCLYEISKLRPKSIAFPHGIGCKLGGGNWQKYFNIINNFDCYVKSVYNTEVFICRYES